MRRERRDIRDGPRLNGVPPCIEIAAEPARQTTRFGQRIPQFGPVVDRGPSKVDDERFAVLSAESAHYSRRPGGGDRVQARIGSSELARRRDDLQHLGRADASSALMGKDDLTDAHGPPEVRHRRVQARHGLLSWEQHLDVFKGQRCVVQAPLALVQSSDVPGCAVLGEDRFTSPSLIGGQHFEANADVALTFLYLCPARRRAQIARDGASTQARETMQNNERRAAVLALMRYKPRSARSSSADSSRRRCWRPCWTRTPRP